MIKKTLTALTLAAFLAGGAVVFAESTEASPLPSATRDFQAMVKSASPATVSMAKKKKKHRKRRRARR